MSRLSGALGSQGACKAMIGAAALVWGVSFVVLKGVTEVLPTYFTLFVRFVPAALILLVAFRRRFLANLDAATVRYGVLLGVANFVAYALQTVGLTMTTPGKNAFITSSYCVLVPFCAWLLGMGRPQRNHVAAALVCMVGLGLVGLDGGLPLNAGDVLTLGGAVCYAGMYAGIAKWGPGRDAMAVTVWELAVSGALSLGATLALEPAPAPADFTPQVVAGVAMLSVLCSALAFAGVNYAFTKVDPAEGALLSSLESPIGAITSVLVGAEVLTGRSLAGFVLIFAAVLWSQVGPALVGRAGAARARGDAGGGR